jgi:hypothetical protein
MTNLRQTFETLTTDRSAYDWNEVRTVLAGSKIKNWMKVRNMMATVNAERGWVRDHSDLNVERYIPAARR